MQGLSQHQDFKATRSTKEPKPATEGFLLSCFNTCESFQSSERPASSQQSSTRKQAYSAAPFRDPSGKSSLSKNNPVLASDRNPIQKFSSLQVGTVEPGKPRDYVKKRFQPSSKLHLLKANLAPLNPNKQSSLNQLSQLLPRNSSSVPIGKEKLESLDPPPINRLLEELDRQHEAFKQSVEAIRASLSGSGE